ncbi:TatD family hydrolase [Seramator thermalis]|uniref:TatD family hydrolase n=1 Tax=Seramator thermalis TaxID=2496270 RepID=UPI00101C7C5E|nr:TatD family hydrolase [Seramator thermalis]
MNLIDTHSHLYEPDFSEDLSAVVDRALGAGVSKVLLPNIDDQSIDRLKKTYREDQSFFIPMMGLHPSSVDINWERRLETIYGELISEKYIAVGEIGIDLYWDTTYEKEQIFVFEEQLRWSIEKELPVSIHSRNASQEVLRSIRKVGAEKLKGVFHSFAGTFEELSEILQLPNFYVGINGIVTFKNSNLAETLRHCPIERLVIETDAPYLSPVPFCGKRNEPSYISAIVNKLSAIYNLEQEEIAEITKKNADKLFQIFLW